MATHAIGKQFVNSTYNVRQCKDCKRLFELNGDNFFVQRYHMRCSGTYTSRFQSRCKGCHNAYEKARYQRNVALGNRSKTEQSRNNRFKRLYGLTSEIVDSMYAKGCEICGTQDNGKNNLHVDHDHKTGAVRGCLCVNCNQGLGNFFDDPDRLMKAIQYLKKK